MVLERPRFGQMLAVQHLVVLFHDHDAGRIGTAGRAVSRTIAASADTTRRWWIVVAGVPPPTTHTLALRQPTGRAQTSEEVTTWAVMLLRGVRATMRQCEPVASYFGTTASSEANATLAGG